MKRSYLLIVSLIALSGTASLFISALPAETTSASQDRDTLRIAGLRERVTVRRDERGIPYIEAANDADLYFAQGYVTAGDRLWQMDLLRRTARGELAEIFGKGFLKKTSGVASWASQSSPKRSRQR